MNEQDYLRVKAYHQSLQQEAAKMRQLRSLRKSYPTLWDGVLLRMGNLLVSVGEKIRCESAYSKIPQECA